MTEAGMTADGGRRRVVVTGIGLHTPLGDAFEQVFDRIVANETGVVPMPEWAEIDELHTRVGAPVPNFDGKHIPRKVRRTMGRIATLSASAAEQAVKNAGLEPSQLQDGRTAIIVGSTAGSGSAEADFWDHVLNRKSARGIKSTLFFRGMAHTCAANVALHLGINGELYATNSACSSSNQAIGLAASRIRTGHCEVALAGGAEELHVSGAVIFGALGAATANFNDRHELTPRPFDKDRDGIVIGEGAGIFVLEALEHALARNAPILAEVLGHGTTCDAYHIASPSPDGMKAAIRVCLDDAGVEPSAVEYINAHATGTTTGDASEAEALHDLFGDTVPVSSSKGHLGHTLGACGVIESAVCVQAMRSGILPATRNLDEPDVAPIHLLREPENRAVSRVLKTNFAFGGVNSVLLFGRADDI